jgi:hypothetical protein
LRIKIPFLLDLYKNGVFTDVRPEWRIAFVFFNGILAPAHFAMVRKRLSVLSASCIYLYDDRVLNYGLGVRQLGADYRATDEALRTMLQQFDVERVFTIGYSSGAFAAIRTALAINAYGTIAFSPFTTFLDRDTSNDGRGKSVIDRFKQIAPEVAREVLIDLVPVLKQRNPALKLVSIYGDAMVEDVWHSKRLNDLDDAYTIAIKDVGVHDVLMLLIARGVFGTLFGRLSEGKDVEDILESTFSLGNIRASKGLTATQKKVGLHPISVEASVTDLAQGSLTVMPRRLD